MGEVYQFIDIAILLHVDVSIVDLVLTAYSLDSCREVRNELCLFWTSMI